MIFKVPFNRNHSMINKIVLKKLHAKVWNWNVWPKQQSFMQQLHLHTPYFGVLMIFHGTCSLCVLQPCYSGAEEAAGVASCLQAVLSDRCQLEKRHIQLCLISETTPMWSPTGAGSVSFPFHHVLKSCRKGHEEPRAAIPSICWRQPARMSLFSWCSQCYDTDVTKLTGDKPTDQNELAEAELKKEEMLLEGRRRTWCKGSEQILLSFWANAV